MDSLRIEAYLRSACSVLNFDIGELWVARRLPGQSPTLRFIKLYTTPTYRDFHNLLIRPNCPANQEEEKHCFSPIICRCVCDGGQIVWANTRSLEGLVGRTDLPLNSGVGMPICSVGYDLCILVLFAVQSIPMTPNAIEFLLSIARAASTGDGGFIPSSISMPVTSAKTDQFVGLWDMTELLETYSEDVAFRLLPIGKLQAFLDYKETTSFIEIFEEYKNVRDNSFQARQLEALQTGAQQRKAFVLVGYDRSGDGGDSDSSWYSSDDIFMDASTTSSTASTASSSSFVAGHPFCSDEGISDIDVDTLTNSALEDAGPGAFNLPLLDELGTIEDTAASSSTSSSSSSSSSGGRVSMKRSSGELTVIPQIDARASYRCEPSRFHEFMVAILGMTFFDAGELWFVSDQSSEQQQQQQLYLVAALYRDKSLQTWSTEAKDIRLKSGEDIPGQVLLTAQPYWDCNYCTNPTAHTNRRWALATSLGIRTAFCVPLPGANGVSGVLALYSKQVIEAEPLMVSLVQKAAQILSAGSLDKATLASIDIESIVYNPVALLGNWIRMDEKSDVGRLAPLDKVVVKVNLMGSLANIAGLKKPSRQPSNRDYSLGGGGGVAGGGGVISGSSTRKRSASESDSTVRSSALHLLALGHASGGQSGPPTKKRERNLLASSSTRNDAHFLSTEESLAATRICKIEDCGLAASHRSPYCSEHSGSRRCQHPDCSKCAQGATRFCIAHGGGRRCTFAGCNKGARDKFFCAAHGGGKRCSQAGCNKSAVGGSGMCTAHGGGKRCQVKGCDKSSQSSTNFCVKHGGGRKCIAPDCTKVARGRTDFCASHGVAGGGAGVGGGTIRCRSRNEEFTVDYQEGDEDDEDDE